jgi:GNAT superfamily N-acetyltransferase
MEELHAYHQPMWPRDFLPDWRERWKLHIAPNDDRLFLLARDAGEPIGMMIAALRRDPTLFVETYAHLEDAYVRARYRRGGLGSLLVARVEEWAQGRGASEVRLGVVAANALGVAFWTKSGFAPLSHQMSKTLAGSAA